MNLASPKQHNSTVFNITYNKIAERKLERVLGEKKKRFIIYRHSPAKPYFQHAKLCENY